MLYNLATFSVTYTLKICSWPSWELLMPRASWSGFLRHSLVSCPIYLSPATTRAKPIRLHQVWRPAAAHELDRDRDTQVTGSSTPWLVQPEATARADQGGAPTRIALRPHDPSTGDEIEKLRVIKGYEYDCGQFVTFSAEELKALDVESSQVIDLETFLPRGDIDPVYVDTSYYLYPDGPIAVEALRVIGAAMAEACVVGIGRLALSQRERIVTLEPRGSGMALFTLRAADEVRAAQFGDNERDLDPEMVAIARAIIRQRLGKFDPSAYRDRYSRGVARADRSQAEGDGDQAASGQHAAPGDRFDGGFETQSRTGDTCHRLRVRERKASQADGRSPPALIAATGRRRRKKEGKARDRPGRRHETAKEGVNIAVKGVCATQIAAGSAERPQTLVALRAVRVVCEESRSRCGGWQNAAGGREITWPDMTSRFVRQIEQQTDCEKSPWQSRRRPPTASRPTSSNA